VTGLCPVPAGCPPRALDVELILGGAAVHRCGKGVFPEPALGAAVRLREVEDTFFAPTTKAP